MSVYCSYIMCDVLWYKFMVDCNALKIYIINHGVTITEKEA